jgi:hypothetical protein
LGVIVSGGTQVDDLLHTTFASLVDTAAAAGIDLPALLAKPVKVKLVQGDKTTVITVSLLEAIEITNVPTEHQPSGQLAIVAGLLLHTGEWSAAPAGANGTSGYGAFVQEAGILPAIPPTAGLLGGKLRHIVVSVPDNGGTHIDLTKALAVPLAGAAPGIAAGLLEAQLGTDLPDESVDVAGTLEQLGVTADTAGVVDSGMEFIGDDIITISFEVCVSGSCSGLSVVAGTGLALFPRSPLDPFLSIKDIPVLWNDCLTGLTVSCPTGPIAAIDQLDVAVSDLAAQLLSNPAVSDALGAVPLPDLGF